MWFRPYPVIAPFAMHTPTCGPPCQAPVTLRRSLFPKSGIGPLRHRPRCSETSAVGAQADMARTLRMCGCNLVTPRLSAAARATTPTAWRCWRRSGAPRHRVSAAKRTPSGQTAWGPEVRQFRLWAEQRGCGGMGAPPGPPKLHYSTAHARAETITPLYSTDYLFVSFTVQAERSNPPKCLR